MEIKGSKLYDKYKNVHFGALVNLDSDLRYVNSWLRSNLFFKDNYDDGNHKDVDEKEDNKGNNKRKEENGILDTILKPLIVTKSSASVGEVLKQFNISEKTSKNICRSFILTNVFKTNDAEKKEQDYCDYRLLLIEYDLMLHPMYGDIKSQVEEIKSQVCAAAKRIRNNGKNMKSVMSLF
jgi:hypothetical protein